jgi:hypothetical protein
MKNVLLFSTLILVLLGSAYSQEKTPKFSGLMFGDYFYVAGSHDSTQKDLNGFQFRRIYITTDYTISDNFDSRFRLEADQSGASLTAGGKVGVMVKDAWLRWKNIFDGSDLIFGISPTPAFDVSEGAWGHRYLEKTIMDLNGIVPSRDLGADLKGKFDDKGTVKYWVKIGNNSGNAPENNKYKRFYGLLEFDPSPDLVFTVYGDYASYPKIADPFGPDTKDNSAFVGAAFLNYRQKGSFSLGAEGYYKSQQNNTLNSDATALASQNGFGVSVWGYVNFTETIQLVARFDTADPNSDADNDGRNMILAGLQFNPAKNISITPNVETFSYQRDGVDSDVVPRVTFYWEF